MKECLLYVFSGFLESGKTTLIQETLLDPQFQSDESNLILVCEEGTKGYDDAFLKQVNAQIVMVDDVSQLNEDFLEACEQHCHPDRVLVELNGMWSVDRFLDLVFPLRWILVQILSTVDASTFDLYLTNMRKIVYEQLRHSETIIFNRCNRTTNQLYLRNNIKAMNRGAQIIYENENGTIEPLHEASLPFAMDSSITLSDHDYGIWYMDALEHPRKYEGKQITYQAKVYPSPKAQASAYEHPRKYEGRQVTVEVKVYPVNEERAHAYVAGREAMVCCSEDTSLIALWVFTEQELPEVGTWLQISGTISVAYDADYGGEVCMIKETERKVITHLEDYVYFT